MPVSTNNTDVLTASLGKPIVLAYGRHVVGGNVILKDETDAEQTILFIALGDASGADWGGGEWDALEELLVNGVEWDVSSPENIQFHKGLAGELSSHVAEDGSVDVLYPEGVGSLYPFTEDGDQKVDSLTPPGVQGLTFSRTAYLALRIPFDVFAPGPELSVISVFRARKVRIFDAQGVQTSFEYSENPAWQIADLLTTIRGLADSRLDWASFKAAADYCDALIDPLGDGAQVKRFVSHIAFTEEVDFDQGLQAVLSTCRGILLDEGGAIKLRIDQARSSVFDFTMDNIVEGSFAAFYKDTRAVANRLEMLFRDLDNDFAVMSKLWNHEPQQTRTGRVIPARLALGNMPQHQAERIGNYLLTRAIDNNLFCKLRGSPASFALLPGDVARVAHDAAPWGQSTFGANRWETFEVIEVTDNPDETRDFLLQVYRASTYPDTAGPAQNLIGTTVRRRPAAPPPPEDWELVADADGSLRLGLTIPAGADYRTGDLTALEEIELLRVETTLAAALALTDTTLTAVSSDGFSVGDYINIGQEVLQIVGPGVENGEPTSTIWEVARAQKLSQAQAAANGDSVYRLTQREFHFTFPPGFTLARAHKRHTLKFRPGNVRILHATLRFTSLSATSEPAELPFWATWESELGPALFGSLPGLRVTSGRLATMQVPGPLRAGDDLAPDLFLEAGIAIGIVSAELNVASQDGPVQFRLDSIYSDGVLVQGGIAGIPQDGTKSGPVSSGAKETIDTGNRVFRLVITAVGATNPGQDLTVIFTY